MILHDVRSLAREASAARAPSFKRGYRTLLCNQVQRPQRRTSTPPSKSMHGATGLCVDGLQRIEVRKWHTPMFCFIISLISPHLLAAFGDPSQSPPCILHKDIRS
jgi:hypothetical protein